MNVIRCNHVVEHAQTKTFPGFKKLVDVAATITLKLEEKFSLMAAVCDMPDVPWQKIAVGTWHRRSLEAYFPMQKGSSKPLNDAFYAMFRL